MHDENDQLESDLRRLPPRAIPTAWRRDILAACDAGRCHSALVRFLLWLWPGPAPVAVLAGLWLVILGFFLNTPPEPPTISAHLDMASIRAAREERQAIFAQLDETERARRGGAAFAAPLRSGGHP